MCDQPFELYINDLVFIGRPVNIKLQQGAHVSTNEVSLFNVVLAAKQHPSVPIQQMLVLTERVATALLYEERRNSYVTREVTAMMKASDAWLHSDEPENLTNASFTSALVAKSSLANSLHKMFVELCATGTADLELNGWITLSLSLLDAEQCAMARFPYETLLLLDEPKKILAELPCDSSPSLRKLIEDAYVKLSFSELHLKTGISLTQLYRLSAHLCCWGKARIIHAMAPHNVYVLTEKAIPTDDPGVEVVTPSFSYLELLDRFSTPRKIEDHLQTINARQHDDFYRAIGFLMRTHRLGQLFTYVVFTVPRLTPIDEDDASVPLTGPATKREIDFIHSRPDDDEAQALLVKLMPWLRGDHTVDEIAYHGGIDRARLDMLIQTHEECLVTFALS
eukprot:TRINITY_DN1748_c0_g1_i2.p1 TRINITY_DN1748_c0_g1~~TRINITY_DN1748_c0_g1_i2.p1  ORF type:complete len:394 (-),score=72.32 TRINITY_DN1748_c0_g1_i2:30-1211(-)